MSRDSNVYIFGFASVITIICAIILGGAATVLKERQDINADVDTKSKVLMALSQYEEGMVATDVQAFFTAEGNSGKSVEKVDFKMTKDVLAGLELKKVLDAKDKYSFFLYKYYASAESKLAGKPDAYVLPIEGYGLWSTCYGFLALEGDIKTVKGIIYYKHAETPGLGAQIKDNVEWTAQFAGKTFNPNDPLRAEKNAEMAKAPTRFTHISAATFTLNGVDQMLNDYTKIYSTFLGYKGVN